MTILPESIDLASLPWLPLDEKSAFPKRPTIYFAIDGDDAVQYIGRTTDARQRWAGHHRYEELSKMKQVKIAYLFVDDITSLPLIEAIFIHHYKPPLNRLGVLPADRADTEGLNATADVMPDSSKMSYSELFLNVLADDNVEVLLGLMQKVPRFAFVNSFENRIAGRVFKKEDIEVQNAVSSIRKVLFESPIEYLVRIKNYRFLLLFGLSDYCQANPDFLDEYLEQL